MAERSPFHDEERKVATVLFADLVGSTALGERFDVEPLGEIVGAFHRAAASAAQACDGSVDFIGDGVVAVFGVPLAVERHQARALEAADQILAAVGDLNARLQARYGVTLGVRIGVNTGDVLVEASSSRGLGRMAGDTFNVAARLQEVAGPGEILASERTMAAVRDRAVVDLGELALPGRSGRIHAFRVGPLQAGGRTGAYGPLIGRDPDLARLTAELDLVAQDRARRLVTVVGEAGIGKSHLLDTFATVCASYGGRVSFASCRPFGSAAALEPIAQLAVGTQPVGSTSSPEAAIRRRLERGGEDVEALVRAIGVEQDGRRAAQSPGLARRNLAAGWRRFVSAVCRDELHVFLIEDLHWATPEVVELLAAAVEPEPGRLLVVGTARPEFQVSHPGWPGHGARSRVVRLAPLDPEATEEIARRMDESAARSEGFGRALHRLTEGNPFFVVELMRSFGERAMLPEAGALLLDHIDVPDSVHSVIAGRIDRLTRGSRRFLQAAAVLGREFWPDVVADLTGIEDRELDAALSELLERRMLERVAAAGTDPPYRFFHALTRDVAYGSIPRRSLHGLHETAARQYLARGRGSEREVAPLVAHHLSESHATLEADWEVEPAHAERVRADAVKWSIAAARKALEETALSSAIRLASHALDLASGDTEIGDAYECLGRAHFFAYEGDDAWEMLTRAGDLADGAGHRSPNEIALMYIQALEAAVRWPGGMYQQPDPADLKTRLDRAFALLGSGDSIERVRLLTIVGFWPYATVGRPGSDLIGEDRSIEAADEAAAMARRLGEVELESAALDALTSVWISSGDYRRADAVLDRRLQLFDRLSDPWEQGDLCAMGGWVKLYRADYIRGMEWARRGIEEFGDEYPSVGLHCLNWLGLNLFRAGRWTEALDWIVRLESELGGLQDPAPYLTPFIAAAALVYHLRGEDEETDRLLDILDRFEQEDRPAAGTPVRSRWAEYLAPIVADRGDPDTALDLIARSTRRRASRRGDLLWTRCWVVGAAGRWDEVDDLVGRCARQADEYGTPIVRSAAATLKARERWAAGRAEEAAVAYTEGLRQAIAVGDGWTAAWAAFGLAQIELAAGRRDRAAIHGARAADGFRHLGAAHALADVERLLGSDTA